MTPADKGRAIKAQLARIEDEHGPMPVPIVRHDDECEGGDCSCEDRCRARRFTSWVDALMAFEADAVAEAVSDLLRSWERYGRPWPDLADLTKRVPKRPPDPIAWAEWERVMRAALYGEVDQLDERLLAAIGGEGNLPTIAEQLERGRTMPLFRRFAQRWDEVRALPEAPRTRLLPAHVRRLATAAEQSPSPSRRPRSKPTRVLSDDAPPPPPDPEWAAAQRKALAKRFGGEAS